MEKHSLTFQGHDLGIECTKSNDCACAFCASCRFAIELVANVLAIAIENKSPEHFRWLSMNVDGLLLATAEAIEAQQEGKLH